VTALGAGVVGGGGGCVLEWSGFRRTSKILFGNMVCLSFRWLPVIYSAYVWNLSNVLWCGPFLWCCSTCGVLCILSKEWLCLIRYWENFDVWLLVWNACLCSYKLTAKLQRI
jgi:hypothetical protein